MDQMLKQEGKSINHVYNFVVSNERILFDRLSTTRIHTASGRIYTKTHPPRIEGKDDKTGETLDIFEEDSEKSVRKRLQAHKLFTVALIDHYRKKGIVTDTDASGSLESIYEQIVQFLPEKVPWYESLKSVLWLGEGIGKAISPVLFYEGFYFAKRVLSLVSFGKL
jgi:adenylate kinase family enzyme